jgi:hypothetical protein
MRLAWFALLLAACGASPLADVCSAPAQCDGGRTYRLCTVEAGTGAVYRASDGQAFPCVAANDCREARDQVTAWCQGQVP